MPRLLGQLELDRCPHCGVNTPTLKGQGFFTTTTHTDERKRFWSTYICSRCGGVVLAAAPGGGAEIMEIYPDVAVVSQIIPEPARSYLMQAIESLHAPAGCMMLCASAVDAMLKAKSYKDGSLYTRINRAVEDHLITPEMGQWAHEVRLDANEQRHADEAASLPAQDDARRCVDFALALGEFLYVLPSRVKRGLEDATQTRKPA